MKYFVSSVLALIIYLLAGCQSRTADIALDCSGIFEVRYNILNKYDWKVYSCEGSESTYLFTQVRTTAGDTVLVCDLRRTLDTLRTDRWNYGMELVKSFKVNGERHSIHYDSEMKFMYHYKVLEPSGKFYLLEGKYYFEYLFDHASMSAFQRKYFELHKDSLTRVKGNELPPLPER